MEKKARVIAFYLPQFHPIPENDEWWGKGFTEWTNVGKAKKLFRGHYQPRVPADLGYYDLRVSESRKAQADMASEHGIEGFCYWHYWFGNGKRLIERPLNEVSALGEPDFPFSLAWANESWKGFPHGLKNRNTLIEQLYPGIEDYKAHFYEVLPFFKDKRYITVEGKPLFMIYKPLANLEIKVFIETWRDLARENGLDGIFFVGHSLEVEECDEILSLGCDAVSLIRLHDWFKNRSLFEKVFSKIYRKLANVPVCAEYERAMKYFTGEEDKKDVVFPFICPNWDHSPRSGTGGIVLNNSTPELFEKHARKVIESVQNKQEEHKIIFAKSWNEWAEGNYLEPDLKFGMGYLKALKRVLVK